MSKKIEFNGVKYDVPDDATEDEITELVDSHQGHGRVPQEVLDRNTAMQQTRAGGAGYGDSPVPKAEGQGVLPALTRVVKGSADFLKKGAQFAAAVATGDPVNTGRLVNELAIEPHRQELQKAQEYELKAIAKPESADYDPSQGEVMFANGSHSMAAMHRVGAGIPVVGPLAANLVDRYMGGDPTGAVTEAAGIVALPEVGKYGAGKLKRAVGKAAYPMADRMIKTPEGSEFNPVEAHTPLEIKQYANDHSKGVPINMTAAEITEHGGLRALQGVGEKSAFGSELIAAHKNKGQGGLLTRMKKSMQKASPTTPTKELAGKAIQDSTNAAEKLSHDNANKTYAEWKAKNPGTVDIDLSEVNKKYGNQLEGNADILGNIPAQQAGAIKAILGKAKEFGLKSVEDGETVNNPTMDLEAVRQMRSHWLDAKREMARSGRANSREVALINDIIHDLDGAVEQGIHDRAKFNSRGTELEATAAGDQAVQEWRDANAEYKANIEDFHEDGSPLTKIRETPTNDLVKVPGRVLDKGEGGNPATIRLMRQRGVDVNPLKREVMDRAVDTGFNNTQNRLAGFEDDYLQELFADEPEVLADLYKSARIGKSLKLNSNPSNSGGTLASRSEIEAIPNSAEKLAQGDVMGAGSALMSIVGYPAAKLTTAKWFNDWMTRVPEGKVGRWLLDRKEPGDISPTGPIAPNTPSGPNAPSTPPPPPPPPLGSSFFGGQPMVKSGNASSKLRRSETPAWEDRMPNDFDNESRDFLDSSPSFEQEEAARDSKAVSKSIDRNKRKGASAKLRRAESGTEAPAQGDTDFNFGANADDAAEWEQYDRDQQGAAPPPTVGGLTPGQGRGTMGVEAEGGRPKLIKEGKTTRVWHSTNLDAAIKISDEGLVPMDNPYTPEEYAAAGHLPEDRDPVYGPFVSNDMEHTQRVYGNDYAKGSGDNQYVTYGMDVPDEWIEATKGRLGTHDDGLEINLQRPVPREMIKEVRVSRKTGRAEALDDAGMKQEMEENNVDLQDPRSAKGKRLLKKVNPEGQDPASIGEGVGPGAMFNKKLKKLFGKDKKAKAGGEEPVDPSRRSFLKKAGTGAAGAAASTMLPDGMTLASTGGVDAAAFLKAGELKSDLLNKIGSWTEEDVHWPDSLFDADYDLLSHFSDTVYEHLRKATDPEEINAIAKALEKHGLDFDKYPGESAYVEFPSTAERPKGQTIDDVLEDIANNVDAKSPELADKLRNARIDAQAAEDAFNERAEQLRTPEYEAKVAEQRKADEARWAEQKVQDSEYRLQNKAKTIQSQREHWKRRFDYEDESVVKDQVRHRLERENPNREEEVPGEVDAMLRPNDVKGTGGPGAMLAKGNKLSIHPGPETGPSARIDAEDIANMPKEEYNIPSLNELKSWKYSRPTSKEVAGAKLGPEVDEPIGKSRDILDGEGKKVGTVRYNARDNGLHIGWVGVEREIGEPAGKRTLNIPTGDMVRMKNEILGDYPNVTKITAERVGGTRSKLVKGKEFGPQIEVPVRRPKLEKAVPEWPENYRNADHSQGGGANYDANQLAEFKKKHGIGDTGDKVTVYDPEHNPSGEGGWLVASKHPKSPWPENTVSGTGATEAEARADLKRRMAELDAGTSDDWLHADDFNEARKLKKSNEEPAQDWNEYLRENKLHTPAKGERVFKNGKELERDSQSRIKILGEWHDASALSIDDTGEVKSYPATDHNSQIGPLDDEGNPVQRIGDRASSKLKKKPN